MVSLSQMTIWEDTPVSIAQAILDKSKNIMSNFYYGLIKKVYGERATMLYGDTDSAYLEIYTDNFFEDMKPYAAKLFDTSVYVDKETGWVHPASKICNFPIGLNKKKAGLMADDSPNDFITEYWGTASKEYCCKKEFGKPVLKAKGIGKKTRHKLIT